MKKVIWPVLLMLLFLIFGISTIGIDKSVDLSTVPGEITSVLTPDKVEQAIIFSNFRDGWYFFSTAFSLLVLAGILWFGFSRRIRSVSEKLTDKLHQQSAPMWLGGGLALLIALLLAFMSATDKQPVGAGGIFIAVAWGVVGMLAGRHRGLAVQVFFIVILTLILQVVGLPLSYYRDFVIEHHFNLSTQTFGNWLADTIKSSYLMTLSLTVLVTFAYWGIRRRARDWWLWIGVAAIPIMIIVMVILPVFIEPMFNKFEPLQDQVLSARILGMAEKAGISGGRVYQVDMSSQTQKINAYVTGLFGSKRIVLWDTTIKKLTPDEVAFVMAHEMGHYVLNHIWIGIALFSVIFLILLFIVFKTIGWVMAKFGASFGFSAVGDIASLPLLMLMLGLMLFLLDPVINGFSRKIEHDADRFALDLTHDPASGISAFVKMANENLSNPQPSAFVEFWEYSHPPLKKRIDFCASYETINSKP